jgi:hypothetical protein
MGNPGYHAGQDDLDARDPAFMELSLGHLAGTAPFPWHLGRWRLTAAGRYWSEQLGSLVRDVGEGAVSMHLAVAQSVPYHSKDAPPASLTLPSQSFTNRLVEAAIDRGALIVAWRSRSTWLRLVPALDRAHVVRPRYPRFPPRMTPGGNLEPSAYRQIREALAGTQR